MPQQITMTNNGSQLLGEVKQFDVTAKCPHCENETSVSQYEIRSLTVQCQHCDEEFRIYLEG